MIKFTSITMKNFLSYGNVPTVVVLDRPGTTLVVGEDLDNTSTGTGANGVGKTVLLNALVYAVYDKPVSNISKDNLVNNVNKKNMEVAVEFQTDGKTYTIVRARKTKAGAAGNHVHLYEDGKDITPDSVSNTNDKIEKIIGIPYELFVRIVAFSATHTPFLDLPVRSPYAANQTDIIEELFDLKTLSEKASILKEHIKETEQKLAMHKARVDLLEKEHARHEKQLQSAEQRVLNWQQTNQDEIAGIEAKLQRIADIDFDEQSALHEQLTQVDADLRDAIEHHQKTESTVSSVTEKRNKIGRELEHLRDAKCPYCLQAFEDAAEKISEKESLHVELSEALEAAEAELTAAEDAVEETAAKHKEVKSKITVKNLKELMEIRSKQDHYTKRLKELRVATNPFLEPLQELEEVELEEIDMSEINNLTKVVEHQKFLLKLLTKKDSFVRKALLNKNIPFLNQRLQHYLVQLGLTHTVEFTHEMTASISQFGRPLDFGNLSNGQRARVNIALSFAFRDVLQSIHDHINVCMLDEVLDVGLDAIGVQAAARMLKHKARDEGLSMYVISHRDEIDSAFDHRMTVQMSKGFSYIKFED